MKVTLSFLVMGMVVMATAAAAGAGEGNNIHQQLSLDKDEVEIATNEDFVGEERSEDDDVTQFNSAVQRQICKKYCKEGGIYGCQTKRQVRKCNSRCKATCFLPDPRDPPRTALCVALAS